MNRGTHCGFAKESIVETLPFSATDADGMLLYDRAKELLYWMSPGTLGHSTYLEALTLHQTVKNACDAAP